MYSTLQQLCKFTATSFLNTHLSILGSTMSETPTAPCCFGHLWGLQWLRLRLLGHFFALASAPSNGRRRRPAVGPAYECGPQTHRSQHEDTAFEPKKGRHRLGASAPSDTATGAKNASGEARTCLCVQNHFLASQGERTAPRTNGASHPSGGGAGQKDSQEIEENMVEITAGISPLQGLHHTK